jgi:hypothetical protein
MDFFCRFGRNISPLDKYKKNIFSQNGEDGIIQKLFEILNLKENIWVCEFGAWDGMHLSNTFALVEKGAKAVYIEGDPLKYKDLIKTTKTYKNIIPINSYVKFQGKNSLDAILSKTKIPKEFDLLSIDIDSYDLDCWDSLKKYSPKIVIIEINSSYSPGILNRHNTPLPGNSFSSTLAVANQKNYSLVTHIGNLIFVHNDYIKYLKYPSDLIKNPNLLFNDFWINNKILFFFDWVLSSLIKITKTLFKFK